jgi:hypothetical protein
VGVQDNRPLLDVGVGGSRYRVIEAARHGLDAVGSDFSFEAFTRARAFADDEGVGERTWRQDRAARDAMQLKVLSRRDQ